VSLPCDDEQFSAQLLPFLSARLDRVAIGAQGDHLNWVVRAAHGEVLDVVDFEDRLAFVGLVANVA
jgi:hypothetical protein